MKNKLTAPARRDFRLPHVGQRIVKTTVAVFLCLMVYYLLGYRGGDMPAEAGITAIVCMQPYVRDTRQYAKSRFAGTFIGAVWGLLFLLLMLLIPALGRSVFCLYSLMALGVLASLYTAVTLHQSDSAGQAAIVFLCVVIAFPDIEAPLLQTLHRMAGVLLGTASAIAVNVFRLPREKNRDLLFFVRTRDLAPDRFSSIPPAAMFRLNYLYEDGAKICLMSEHAPAFFALQMHGTHLSVPLIVMDGAAIFDAHQNRFLHVQTIPPEVSSRLRVKLDSLGLSYFIYTVHHNKTCIFHSGPVSAEERTILERMRRSPYRSYLEGEIYDAAEIVYLKIIAEAPAAEKAAQLLKDYLPGSGLRVAVRAQEEGLVGLYFYSELATVEHAKSRLIRMLREKEPALHAVDVFLRTPYRSELDAMRLLHKLGSYYEPLRLPWKTRRRA